MRYADTLLTQGEVIVVRARQHWLALFLDARTAVALWIVGALMLVAVLVFNVTDRTVRDILSYIGIGAILLGVLVFLYHFWRWWSQDYLVTNRRILKVEGVLNKHAADSSLEKINDAILDQNVMGRMLDYGDLDILTAAEAAIDRYKMLNHAPAFKREMLQQKYALETEFAYHAPPTPPLRAASEQLGPQDPDGRATEPPALPRATLPPAVPAPAPSQGRVPDDAAGIAPDGPDSAAAAAAAAAVGGPAAAAVALPLVTTGPPAPGATRAAGDDATAVTQTLARLADLRDRGAITPEEYEVKKNELLDRL